jgi:hypothetical protein
MSSVRWFAWLRGHVYLLLAIACCAVVAVPFLKKADSQFDNVYLRAAARLQAGADIYPLQDGYLYPPLMAWLAIPFTHLPQNVARVAWLGLNLASLAALLMGCWRLSGGSRLNGTADWREHLICWLGLTCALRFSLDCLQNQQTDVLIAAVVVGGCLLLAFPERLGNHTSVMLAATCFGLAAGMKCTALLFAPYLLLRGRWLACLWVGVLAVGLNLLPNLTSTPDSGGLWLGEWVHRYLSVLGRSDHSPGVWGSAVNLNQSWSGALYRWFATTWTWDAAGFQVQLRADSPSPTLLKLLVYGSELLVLGVFAWLMWPRHSKQLSPDRLSPDRQVGESPRVPLECAVVLLLMVLFSPMSSKPHFCTLLLPAWLVARQAFRSRSWSLWACLGLAIVCGALAIKDLATANVASVAMWYGGVTWSAVALLAGCGIALAGRKEALSAGIDGPVSLPRRERLAA